MDSRRYATINVLLSLQRHDARVDILLATLQRVFRRTNKRTLKMFRHGQNVCAHKNFDPSSAIAWGYTDYIKKRFCLFFRQALYSGIICLYLFFMSFVISNGNYRCLQVIQSIRMSHSLIFHVNQFIRILTNRISRKILDQIQNDSPFSVKKSTQIQYGG